MIIYDYSDMIGFDHQIFSDMRIVRQNVLLWMEEILQDLILDDLSRFFSTILLVEDFFQPPYDSDR